MITANELRIGNYVASSHSDTRSNMNTWVIGKVHSISHLDSNYEQLEVETEDEFTWFYKDSYFGIPLTEEILLKCGFRKLDKYTFVLNGYFIHKRKVGFVFNRGRYKVILNSLHELQNNYYYNNNKKELEVNL